MRCNKALFFLFVFMCSCKNKGTINEYLPLAHRSGEGGVSFSANSEKIFYTYNELSVLLNSADSAIAYNYNGNNANPANVDCEQLYHSVSAALCASAQNRRKLTATDIKVLALIVGDTTTYTGQRIGSIGTCFIPHAGFGFFKRDSLIAQVNVCFLCGGIRTIPPLYSDQLANYGGERLAALFKQLDINVVDGNSKLNY